MNNQVLVTVETNTTPITLVGVAHLDDVIFNTICQDGLSTRIDGLYSDMNEVGHDMYLDFVKITQDADGIFHLFSLATGTIKANADNLSDMLTEVSRQEMARRNQSKQYIENAANPIEGIAELFRKEYRASDALIAKFHEEMSKR